MEWDHLTEEARLRGDVSAQLAITQQRVAELTPLAEEVARLRQRESKARWDAEDVKKAFQDLSTRVWQDEEEATRVWKERDKLV